MAPASRLITVKDFLRLRIIKAVPISKRHPDLNLPAKGSILGRKSSITAAFFQSITVTILPTFEEVEEALSILGMSTGHCVCAYCAGTKTEWDHFRPTVIERKPTGYITEIANLVPSCGKCNQSKGNKSWRNWIESNAPLAPIRKGTDGLESRIRRLEEFEKWREPVRLDYIAILGEERWNLYLSLLERCEQEMRLADEMSKQIVHLVGEARQPHYIEGLPLADLNTDAH